MCTAISHCGKYHLFGRTLDLECGYGEQVVITPRCCPLRFLKERTVFRHSVLIGVASLQADTPLYYDAVNEHGLGMAALNFPTNAVYRVPRSEVSNIASFELIAWVLAQCSTVKEAVALLEGANIIASSFSEALPATPLHWIVADKTCSVTVEAVEQGLKIYENPFGVLTNNPPFPYHVTHVADFLQLGAQVPQNNLCPTAAVQPYARGMGAMGLPGDYSSASRFVRAVFAKNHTACGEGEREAVNGFFHIMDTVAVPYGCVRSERGEPVCTVYTSCANTDTGTYYFTTYNDRRIRAVSLQNVPLDAAEPIVFSMSEGGGAPLAFP